MAFDYKKFAAIMQRTLSDADGEALVAIRMANAMLAKANMNWQELISNDFEIPEDKLIAEIKPANGSAFPPLFEQARQSDLEQIFATIMAEEENLTKNNIEFTQSVLNYYNRKGRVTIKQYGVLVKLYQQTQTAGIAADLGI